MSNKRVDRPTIEVPLNNVLVAACVPSNEHVLIAQAEIDAGIARARAAAFAEARRMVLAMSGDWGTRREIADSLKRKAESIVVLQ